MIKCACGCESKFDELDKYGRKRKFIHGHNHTKMSQESRLRLSSERKGEGNPMFGKPTSVKQKEVTRRRQLGIPLPEFIKIKMSKTKKGVRFSEEHKRKLSLVHKGKKLTIEHRKNISLAKKGNKTNLWKGGITKESQIIRTSAEYKQWRIGVFKRDNYTCVECKVVGGYLQADHIKPFSLFPDLRFDLSNGRTLCKDCHKATDTYGKKMNTYIKNNAIHLDCEKI